MKNKEDSPGVYIPPPLLYVLVFLAAIFIQKKISIDDSIFHLQISKIVGVLFFIKTCVVSSSLWNFQCYQKSHYVGLALVYLGISCFVGNWWNIILFPLLLLIVQQYIIKREEKYLLRRFGQEYVVYKTKVRRGL